MWVAPNKGSKKTY